MRLETLEQRKMLAGHGCSISQPPIAQVAAIESIFQRSDVAGESLATAADLGRVEGVILRSGQLSRFDRLDVVRFEVDGKSNVRLGIDQLNQNANFYVLNRTGDVIASSKRSGTRADRLTGTLAGGTYYLAIAAVSYRNISYRLTLDVNPVAAAPPETAPPKTVPVAKPPAAIPAPPAPASPATVAPLNDVAYYGGIRDWNVNAVAAPAAWAAGYSGQGIIVAVIDTGIDLDHPDLATNLYVNPGEIAGNGIDDDQNGFVDDVSGYDFVSSDARPDDGNGHGTHVAGTIAAANNGIGATGVAPDAKILPVRVLDDSGLGSDSSVAAGIRYAADIGAQIINLSLGGNFSSRINSAIDYATSLGSLVIAAAGNESASSPGYPARQSAASTSVLSVGAFNSDNRIAAFSNDVGDSGAVQVDAPGVGIYSTWIGGSYSTLSGTSMAAPHVAGVAALTLSADPSLTSRELRQFLAGGTVGQVANSDAIGKISTLRSVAYAAAGMRLA